MVKRKKKLKLTLEGYIGDLGTKRKNIYSVKRKLKQQRYKGKFKISVKSPRKKGSFTKFIATRK